MAGELPRAHDISEQWITITTEEYSKSSLILGSAKRFSSCHYLEFVKISDNYRISQNFGGCQMFKYIAESSYGLFLENV